MKREFTQREIILILILTMVVLIAGYIKFFSEPVGQQLMQEEDRLADAQEELLTEQSKLSQMQSMQAQLEELQKDGASTSAEIPEYDNIKNVMIQLDAILGTATDYQLTFSDLQFENDLVQRPVQMSFSAGNYWEAKKILTNLHDCLYRCVLSNLSVDAEKDGITSSEVCVTVTATFFEKYNEAAARDDPTMQTEGNTDGVSSSVQ